MSPRTRGYVVAVAAIVGFGLVIPAGTLALLWYLPAPRTWWSAAIFLAAVVLLPAVVGIVGGRHLRRLSGESSEKPA